MYAGAGQVNCGALPWLRENVTLSQQGEKSLALSDDGVAGRMHAVIFPFSHHDGEMSVGWAEHMSPNLRQYSTIMSRRRLSECHCHTRGILETIRARASQHVNWQATDGKKVSPLLLGWLRWCR